MEEIKFRNLTKDEVEVRRGRNVGNEGKVELLIFKNSRVDMAILDETVGNENWAVQYRREGNTLLCGIGIYSEKHNAFIWKWAAGSETSYEATKGEQSDALKRSGFVWNIGRALYTAPRVVVTPKNDYTQYYVQKIGYDDKSKIVDLVIVDESGEVVFNYVGGRKMKIEAEPQMDRVELLKTICGELKHQEGVDKDNLLKFYNFYSIRAESFERWNEKIVRTLYRKWCERNR